MMHIIYRACTADKISTRPRYYSKPICLRTLLGAARQAEIGRFVLIFDGLEESEVIDECLLGYPATELRRLYAVGNTASFMAAYELAVSFPDDDIIYFVEDDYLHTELSLVKLGAAFDDIREADYVTLYDHPVRYLAEYAGGIDISHRDTRMFIAGGHHWRSQESTCMTFASRVSTLKEDRTLFERHLAGHEVPPDREVFRHLQGLLGYEADSPTRLLLGPVPSLATHCHVDWLAPVIDWQSVAKS